MAEIRFYHLQRQSLEAVIPTLLLRSQERGWRSLVKAENEARLAALDDHLWSFDDESFLAHGTDAEPDPAGQPILLTRGDANLNGANTLFLVDGASVPADLSPYGVVALIFDGRDEEAAALAREQWKALRASGHALTYWQQDGEGRWNQRR